MLGAPVPKGAGIKVDEFGKEIVKKYGKDILKKTAKLNFKNTDKILKDWLKNQSFIIVLFYPWFVLVHLTSLEVSALIAQGT